MEKIKEIDIEDVPDEFCPKIGQTCVFDKCQWYIPFSEDGASTAKFAVGGAQDDERFTGVCAVRSIAKCLAIIAACQDG